MRIIAISDTHNKHNALTKKLIELFNENNDSVLIHAGDSCLRGDKIEAEDFLSWYSSLPFKTKIYIPGNHDGAFEPSYSKYDHIEMNELAKELGIIVLTNEIFELNGYKILANSLIPNLKYWAFFAEPEQRERFFQYVDQDADIIISHTPPNGYGDLVPRGIGVYENTGCKYLRNYIDRNKPKLVINGHIHEGYGEYFNEYSKTKIFNCSILDSHYMSFNPITIIEL